MSVPKMSGTFQSGLRLVLAALIAASSAAPPAFRHSHVDAELPHQHDAGLDHHDHGHEYSNSHRAILGEHAGRHVGLSHLHFTWFGPVGPLPLSEGREGTTDRDHGLIPISVETVSNGLPTGRSHLTVFQGLLSSPRAERPVAVTQIAARLQSTTVDAAPLCDSARHERSGVQLI